MQGKCEVYIIKFGGVPGGKKFRLFEKEGEQRWGCETKMYPIGNYTLLGKC